MTILLAALVAFILGDAAGRRRGARHGRALALEQARGMAIDASAKAGADGTLAGLTRSLGADDVMQRITRAIVEGR